MTNFPWQNHFKNSLVGAQESYAKKLAAAAEAGVSQTDPNADASFLAYCLTEKYISTTDYLHWAKDTLEIPILVDDFFMAHAASTRLFEACRELYAWGPHCLPVAEWDGLLMVACLHIPADFPADSSAVFLLASPDRLAETWATYDAVAAVPVVSPNEMHFETDNAPSAEISASTPEPFTAPIESSLEVSAPAAAPADAAEALFGGDAKPIQSLFDANGDLILAEDEASESEAAEGEAESSTSPEIQLGDEAAGMPDGFFAETVVDKPILSELTPVDSETKTQALLVPADDGPAEDSAATVIIAAKTDADVKPVTKGPRSVEVLGPAMSLAEMKSGETTEPAPAAAAPVAAAPASTASASMPKAPMKAANPASSTAAYLLEKTRKQNTETFDKETMAAFQQLKTFFKKSMLLAIGDKDRVVKPLLWNAGFLMNTESTTNEFPLNTPSFLRIVSTTQKPYHGFVTPNDSNDSFFETWNQGEIPDHITVVPFMEGDLIVGMLLGIGEKSAYNRTVLQHTETVAKELSTKILRSAGEHTKTAAVKSVA